ncbi:cupin domain-containing protein [Variovorax paradoxus]|nr:cupin domain-containing protein [Variovorax paradoxus]
MTTQFNADDGQPLRISRAGSRPSKPGSLDNVTGATRSEVLFGAEEPARSSAAWVSFQRGARTGWHSHPLGQVLIVTVGVGRVQRWGGPVEEIRVGDVIRIPPGVKHWHGAMSDSEMVHLAIQEQQDGRVVDWLEKVSDEQYLQPVNVVV